MSLLAIILILILLGGVGWVIPTAGALRIGAVGQPSAACSASCW